MAMTLAHSSFSDREFRDVLGHFATGVAVITSVGPDGARLGATVSSFNSVSLDPPLVLFSIGRNTKAFASWETAQAFTVNILSEEQSAISTRFARAMTDKWQGIEPRIGGNGAALLPGAAAWLECSSYAKHDGGDHLIMVGRVEALALRETGCRPLLFFCGKYRRLDSGYPIDTPPGTDTWLHGW